LVKRSHFVLLLKWAGKMFTASLRPLTVPHAGVYRKSCEVALRLFRNKAEALLGVLKPFIYDPVSEWHGKGMSRLSMELQPRFYVV
jgi:hypothetical protein